jgi:dihydropteroate synthase
MTYYEFTKEVMAVLEATVDAVTYGPSHSESAQHALHRLQAKVGEWEADRQAAEASYLSGEQKGGER